jgi:signal peptidase I
LHTTKASDIPPKPKETTAEAIAGIASVLVSGLFIITFIIQAFEIPSRSMEDTLLVGDHVFVDRLTPASKTGWVGPIIPYHQIQHGDIVVFISPEQAGLHVVKRIIGIPGDRLHLRNGVVYRNGQALTEPYTKYIRHDYNPYRDNFPAVSPVGVDEIAYYWPMLMRDHIEGDDLVIPPGNYFGMGDDRDISLDSRYWGFIPQENIIGRPLFIYWSFETSDDQYMRTSIGERVQFFFHVVLHFVSETRWRRMLHLVH